MFLSPFKHTVNTPTPKKNPLIYTENLKNTYPQNNNEDTLAHLLL